MPDRDETNKSNYDEIIVEENDRVAAGIMSKMVLFGGPQVGFNTNLKAKDRQCFIEIDGEKIVCLAQGGECRYNSDYYSPGLSDAKSWRTPIIDIHCPDRCCYKVLVCDNHPHDCKESVTYYPEYNKFSGQFKRYCRNFDTYLKRDENKEIADKMVKTGKKVKAVKKDGKKGERKKVTWPHYS